MWRPAAESCDREYEVVVHQWRQGVRLVEITLSEPAEKLAGFLRTARWFLLWPLGLAVSSLVYYGRRSFPGVFWLFTLGVLVLALCAVFLRFRRWQEAKRIESQQSAEETGGQAAVRMLRRDRFLSTRAYHALRNLQLSKSGRTMYVAFVALGGSGIILLQLFGVLDGRLALEDASYGLLLAYPGMMLICAPIGIPSLLLWLYCRWRLRAWQRLEESDPTQAASILYMRTRAENQTLETDGAIKAP